MVDKNNIIWDLLAIDYRNKVAILKEEVASLHRKVCFFAPEICPELCADAESENRPPPGKEIFHCIHHVLKDLKIRLERYPVNGVDTPWNETQNSALCLACYRMAMDDLAEALTQLTVVEDRFIQQMEARPLYFPAPRIFRRRHEEFQMYFNDQLINKQQKLVRAALCIIFPKAKNLQNINYRVLSSTEFIPDSRIVHDFIFQKKIKDKTKRMKGRLKGNRNIPKDVVTAKHPYWFQSLPIMLPEMAHEHVHICLSHLKEIGDKKEKDLLEDHFNDLIGEISILFNLLPPSLSSNWQQPMKFGYVIVEEIIADIAATMIFGEAYLLPLFLQLVCVYEAADLVHSKVKYPLSQLPWWGRLQVLLEIFYKPVLGDSSSHSLAGDIETVIQKYLVDKIIIFPPDEIGQAQEVHVFEQHLVDLIISWMRPMVKKACKKKKIALPFSRLSWGGKNNGESQKLELSDGFNGRKFTGLCSAGNLLNKADACYSLWHSAYPPGEKLPTLGQAMEIFLNQALPLKDTDSHGKSFHVEIKNKSKTPWLYPLDQSVPLEYFVWAGYMATVVGMENKDKTIMGSYYQLLVRGFLSGFSSVLETPSQGKEADIFTVGGKFSIIPYNEAAHKTRQLSFVKWRLESFCRDKDVYENHIEGLRQTEPWRWDQEEGYSFWSLAPFSVLLSSRAGFSRRSSYALMLDNESCKKEAKETVDLLSCDMGIFSEEMVICPWMVFHEKDKDDKKGKDCESNGDKEDAIWHLTVQIRIKTSRIYFCQTQKNSNQSNSGNGTDLDPVLSLLKSLAENNLWRTGDTVFSALSWSQIVFILAPRTLNEAFEFKNALQGREEIDRTQTTFSTLISKQDAAHEKKPIEKTIRFQSTLRLGDIHGKAYTELQEALSSSDLFSRVEEVPGIFDIQVTWKYVPTFSDILKIIEIGRNVDDAYESQKTKRSTPSLISDIQTVVARQLG